VTARRAKRGNGGLGVDPPGTYDDILTGRSDLDVQAIEFASSLGKRNPPEFRVHCALNSLASPRLK
jgi:hypothetical protein